MEAKRVRRSLSLTLMLDTGEHFAIARARQALRAAGLDESGDLVRAESTRNEVFIGERVVVRINRQPNQRLHREAAVCSRLPRAPWSPHVIAQGGPIGADYLIVGRKPGHSLAQQWPAMPAEQRRRAMASLGDALSSLHATPTPPDLPPLEAATHLIDPRCVSPLVPLLVAIDDLRNHPQLDRGLLTAVEERVLGLGSCLDDYHHQRLVHGDLSFENVLWDGISVSLVDFEWCRGGAADLDLDVLLRFCGLPFAHVAERFAAWARPEDYLDAPVWLREHHPDLFAHPRLAERLVLYSLAFDMADLRDSADTPAAQRGPLHPVNRIQSLLDHGSYLTPLLRRLDVTLDAAVR